MELHHHRKKGRKAECIGFPIKNQFAVEVLPLCFDVQDRDAVFANLTQIPVEWQAIDVLINNAGLALGRDSFEQANLDDWETMIDTNVKGIMYVTKAVLPFLIQRKKDISSTWVLQQE